MRDFIARLMRRHFCEHGSEFFCHDVDRLQPVYGIEQSL
jgi:hypothetical protein